MFNSAFLRKSCFCNKINGRSSFFFFFFKSFPFLCSCFQSSSQSILCILADLFRFCCLISCIYVQKTQKLHLLKQLIGTVWDLNNFFQGCTDEQQSVLSFLLKITSRCVVVRDHSGLHWRGSRRRWGVF